MDKQLLKILACPVCKGKLIYDVHEQELLCRVDKLAYPIREGIPVMLADEARCLKEESVPASGRGKIDGGSDTPSGAQV